MNDRLEDHLRTALARREPPSDFTGRVMARIPARRPALSRMWFAAVAAAVMLVMFAGSWQAVRERQRQTEAQQAKEDLVYALEVTSAKLQETRSKLLRISGGTI